MSEVDILVQVWLSRWDQIRHSETQRSTITNMILVLSAAGIGFIVQKGLQPGTLLVAIGILVLGCFGMLVSVKYYERFRFHLREADIVRDRIEELSPGVNLTNARQVVSREQAIEFPLMIKLPLFAFWIALHGAVATAGLVAVLIIFRS